MTQQFTAVRQLSAEEIGIEGALDHAKAMAFREAMQAAMDTYRGDMSLPSDHGVDETVAPNDDGGTDVTVIVTLP